MNSIQNITNYTPIANEILNHDPIIPINGSTFGNKHDTLVILNNFFKNHPSAGVEVPLPYGLNAEPHLRESAPNLFNHWDLLKQLYAENPDPDLFFDNGMVMFKFAQIRSEIKRAFEKFRLPAEMQSWLQSIDSFFMVRSTGNEDGKKTANAGGNLSCPYVLCEEMAEKMGEVVASYFDKRSLLNRMSNGDNPFESPLHLFVTVQELIGEPVGGEKLPELIPISVVLFTNEPLYIGTEPFRIMKLSCSFGHGDGVVGNKGVKTDSAYLLQSMVEPSKLYIWYDNKAKPERLVPVSHEGKIKLELVPNPQDLIHRKSLDDQMIQRLFALGQKVEDFFGGPTDMEIVIKGGTIYLVQARPINRAANVPTYMDLEASQLIHQTEVKTLVSGKSGAFFIDSPDQIYVADRLEEAQFSVRSTHKLVIAKEDEPINSHPTIQMSEKGIPCLYHPEGAEDLIQGFKKGQNENGIMAICIQQGIIALAKHPSKVVIKDGYISHPAPFSFSLPKKWLLIHKMEMPDEVRKLIYTIKTARTTEIAVDAFEHLCSHPLLQNITQRITYPPVRALAEELESRVQSTLLELGRSLAKIESGERLQILFYAKALEALLGTADCSVIKLEKHSRLMKEYQQKAGTTNAIFAEETLWEPLTEETKQAWQDLLVIIETHYSNGDVEKLKEFLQRCPAALDHLLF